MNTYTHENALVDRLREKFPAEAAVTDQWLVDRGWDPADKDGTAYAWMESFADRTTDAIKRRDVADIEAQTGFVAELYHAAPDALSYIVDVCYAENLMWDASDDDKVWAWEFISPAVRQFYEAIWDKPEK